MARVAAALFLAIAVPGCGYFKKKDVLDAAAPDAAVDASADVDAGDLDAGPADTPAPPPDPTVTLHPGGPFQGNYKCGASWGPMKISQQGDRVTASHTEAGGKTVFTAQCTAVGTKCTGTFDARDAKTMKSKGGGSVKIAKTPKGDVTYQGGVQPATTCKKQ